MTLPLFDPIDLPPDITLVDVNSIADDALRASYQGDALALWISETGESVSDFATREWDDNEGIFVCEENGIAIGIVIVTDVEGL